MSVNLQYPIVVSIDAADTRLPDAIDRLDALGFMSRGDAPIAPYGEAVEAFLNDMGTTPTYLLLASPECDDSVDGLCCDLCDDMLLNEYLDTATTSECRDTDIDGLLAVMSWWN